MKTLLVTGGAGFIGSNFIPAFLAENIGVSIINLDDLTYAGSLDNLREVASNPRYNFVKGDICDRQLVETIFDTHNVEGVLHFAAESHVDNSIAGPEAFIRTNVFGTFTLLDVARSRWMKAPFETHQGKGACRFLHVSTDEVFGSLGPTGYFTETTPYAPNSPYSASKASSDMLVRSYFHTYGLDVVTTNCSNNYGPKQHSEKFIPTIIRSALAEKPIPVYGDGLNIRDWLFVDDHCSGISAVFMKGRAGETYNIGGGNERTNNQIADAICGVLDRVRPRQNGKSYKELITFVKDRAGHDRRYAIDSTKIKNELGWKPRYQFESGMAATVEWYINSSKYS
jgi:dTDP-glucose 4,6-dehydratase